MSDDDAKSPVDHALDLLVFAPLGFALDARELLPQCIDRGRERLGAQMGMAKVVGQFAVQHGRSEAARHVAKAQGTATAALSDLGVLPGGRPGGPGTSTTGAAPAHEAAPVARPVRPEAGASASLPVHDYDSLAASQVIPRLEGLDPDELEIVRAYEAAGRGRKTILNKIAQLQA